MMCVDQRHQPREILGGAMRIECGAIRPLLDENEMPRVFLIDEKIIGDAELFQFRLLDKLPVERKHDLDGLWLDEVLSDDLELKKSFNNRCLRG